MGDERLSICYGQGYTIHSLTSYGVVYPAELAISALRLPALIARMRQESVAAARLPVRIIPQGEGDPFFLSRIILLDYLMAEAKDARS